MAGVINIEIEVGGNIYNVTVDEAKELRDALLEIYPVKENISYDIVSPGDNADPFYHRWDCTYCGM